MSAKIINSHRYKKTTRKKAAIKKEQKYKYLDKKKKNELKYIRQKQDKEKKLKKKEVDNILNLDKVQKKNSSIYIPKSFKVVGLVFCIVIIAFLSKEIVNLEESPIVKVFSNKDENKNFVKDYDLKVGIANLDTTDILNSKNIVLRELEKISSSKLIKINDDYTITYLGAKTIEKVSNKEYNILLNDKYNISISDIENSIKSIKNAGEGNIYYKYLSNVESIEEISKKQIKIKLLNDNPYFVYALDFPISSSEGTSEYKISNVTDTSILFARNNSLSTLKSIELLNYSDSDKMVEDFRNNNIDVFFASSNNAMQLIGKHEYNLKKYRNGETIFILGNKDSKIYGKKEIRQAIVYSLNREEIVKEVNSNYGELIDLPFIYSDIKYKYDIYGAQNVLTASSWKKDIDGIYIKEEEGSIIRAELNLLVNSEDEIKLKIAEKIRNMCLKSGVVINITAVPQDEIATRVSNKEYDIVLADILVEDYPDISYLQDFLNLNLETNTAILQVNNSSIESLPGNINNLQNVLSDEVACIGIFARNINVVYQKDITGFDNLRYFKIFENIENMGKINDRIGE